MRLNRCPNGHYYDEEKYSRCPHCEAISSDIPQPGGSSETEGFLTGVVSYSPSGRQKIEAGDDRPTEKLVSDRPDDPENKPTEPLYTNVSEQDTEKTVGFYAFHTASSPKSENHNSNQHVTNDGLYRSEQAEINPVVGWLVAVEGTTMGNSFILRAGKNFIGRDENLDIYLKGDIMVSRSIHAILIFEPKQKKFYVQPGDSHSLFYVNGEVVLSNSQLNDRDVIEIGQTKLIFVPFCDERFSWSDILG